MQAENLCGGREGANGVCIRQYNEYIYTCNGYVMLCMLASNGSRVVCMHWHAAQQKKSCIAMENKAPRTCTVRNSKLGSAPVISMHTRADHAWYNHIYIRSNEAYPPWFLPPSKELTLNSIDISIFIGSPAPPVSTQAG